MTATITNGSILGTSWWICGNGEEMEKYTNTVQ